MGGHFLLQGNLLHSETEPTSPALQGDSLPSGPPGKPKSNLRDITIIYELKEL